MSVLDSIKLGEVLLAVGAVGEMSCGITGCFSCRGKQSTSLSSSSLGRSLLLFSKFIGSVGVSVVDSIKLGRVSVVVDSVGEISCSGTGCLSCRGKQSTSLLLSSSSSLSGRSSLLFLLLFSILSGVSVGDSIRLLQLLGTAVGRGAMAVGVEYHGGLGGIGIGNTMVDGGRR